VRRTADAYLAIGALVLIDPSAPLPVLPTVNYVRRLSGSGLQVIVDLPQSVSLKQPVSPNAWIYLGTQFNTFRIIFSLGRSVTAQMF